MLKDQIDYRLRLRVFSLVVSVLSFCSCEQLYDKNSLCIDNTRGEVFSLCDIYSDDFGNKGIVVYQTKTKVLVLSLEETACKWGRQDLCFQLYKGGSIYKGGQTLFHNQTAFDNGIQNYAAFQWCYEMNHKKANEIPELGDWVLPSSSDWDFLKTNWSRINEALTYLESPLDGGYWCSEGYDKDEARILLFSEKEYGFAHKDMILKARAVKYIYYK